MHNSEIIEAGRELFSHRKPCIYQGKILCENCEKYKKCDMRAGRILHENGFVDGYLAGVKAQRDTYQRFFTES